ncbi:MAG: DNA topoisomerase IV subunit A [Desulfobulbaceae bacterium]|jgi:topoisomerase-4 subunit A|nr:DNA topoisomerase IV subunit A [Desulfobulbaceae bacterium]
MTHPDQIGELHQLFDTNFMDYTSYVIRERAIPDAADGLKPVQRRIMQTLFNMDDGRFQKVANVVGDCMKLHPHGDQSIYAALVNLANKGFLIERQGNFGNIYTGDGASAARYIECRLSPLAKATLFNKDLTTFEESYDGRLQEPVVLPSKLPLLVLQGAEGIAVGMATKIMPHNFVEVLEAQKCILREEPFKLYPDFPLGGILDAHLYDDGNGKLKCRARIDETDDKTITITEIPYSTTTNSIMESVEKAAKSGKIKIHSINDYTAETVEIEIKLPRGIYADDTIKALYAFTDCEIAISPNLTVILDNQPATLSVTDILTANTHKLRDNLEKELIIDLDRQQERLQAHLLEQIFIEERLYKQIEECESYELVVETVGDSLKPYRQKLLRDVTLEDIERLLEIKIRRISKYDLTKKEKDIKLLLKKIKVIKKHLKDMIVFTINYIDALLQKYAKEYPRRTELSSFREVNARKVAISNLTFGYQQESGFLGHQVKGDAGFSFPCSQYDKIMLIFKNGMYKVIPVTDKLFVGSELTWMGKVAQSLSFNMIYKNGIQNLSYIKRFDMPKFIMDKEYTLFDTHKRSVIQHLSLNPQETIRIYYTPNKRARSNYEDFSFADFLIKASGAKGKRVSNTRPVTRVKVLDKKDAAGQNDDEPQQSTLFSKDSDEK